MNQFVYLEYEKYRIIACDVNDTEVLGA